MIYDTTSPGKPSLPSGSTMENVMLLLEWATTVKFLQSHPSGPPWSVSTPSGWAAVGFSLGLMWYVTPSSSNELFLIRLAYRPGTPPK